ncbi:MAG: hypothetical protein WBQ78_02450, partial [Gammaproteobacteria bacterium]
MAIGAGAAADGLEPGAAQQAQLELLRRAESEGLEPSDYAVEELEQLAGRPGDPASREFSRHLDEA